MRIHSFFSRSVIGLEVEPRLLRLVKIRKFRHRFVLDQAITQVLPDGLFAEGKIQDWQKFTTILSDLVTNLAIKGSPTAIGLANQLVRSRSLVLPTGLSEAAIQNEITCQVQRDLSTKEPLCVDFYFLPSKVTGYAELHYTVTKQEYVTAYIESVQRAGLLVKIVDVDSYALLRSVYHTVTLLCNCAQAHVLIHKAQDRLMLVLFDAQQIYYQETWFSSNVECMTAVPAKIEQALRHSLSLQCEYLIVSGTFAQQDMLSLSERFNLRVIYADLRQKISYQAASCSLPISDFMLACGLALAEFPQW